MHHLDLIVPVFNEAENLPLLLKRIDDSLRSELISYRVIIVDDHSTDKTSSVVKKLSREYPLLFITKKGERGKAYSILEGVEYAKAEFVVMIDGDVQYPPEVIPEMLRLASKEHHGVIVARRKVYGGSILRRIGSKSIQVVFGRLLLGLKCDVQSGLKLFRRSILEDFKSQDVTPWALDIPLLKAALDLGWTIGEVNITFEERKHGSSKLNLIKPTLQIGKNALELKFSRTVPITIEPDSTKSMIGAGVVHNRKRFITHTTLPVVQSALHTFTSAQKKIIYLILLTIIIGLILNLHETAIILVGGLSFVYFIDVVFNFFLILKSLQSPPEISATPSEIAALKDKDLPIYTVLCPLYKEAHVIPAFLEAIEKMDWPKNKLDVQLLLEADDTESIEAVKHLHLPSHVRAVIVPDSQPKTKPKACNYGLNLAKGEYVVIYDAEDVPSPDQLKKAYLAFLEVGPNVKCLQAKLNYYNPHQNWLTRFFTAEYSLWFDVILTGLQSIGTTIPLGGTSNHFRTKDLMELQGWDPFNVTEDCDLGVRLFKKGYKTAIIDSTTLEEANSNVRNWIRQRSRWIKGYMQTYLIHMRNPVEFAKNQGIHALVFQLTVGGKLAFILINPFLWLLTLSYFLLYRFVGPAIESIYPSIIFYMAVTSLIFGNFMFIYYYMIGCAKREHWTVIKWVYLVPIYWLLVSIAGAIALYQLIVKPHYWEKTVHGLHLKKNIETESKNLIAQAIAETQDVKDYRKFSAFFTLTQTAQRTYNEVRTRIETFSFKKTLKLLENKEYRSSVLYICAMFATNGINLLSNVVLGSELKIVDFGYMNMFISIYYLTNILLSAYSSTINYKVGYLIGQKNESGADSFWQWVRNKAIFTSLLCSGIWVMSIPFLMRFFQIPSAFPFAAFTPILFMATLFATDRGLLKGKFAFDIIALLIIAEPVARFIITLILVLIHHEGLIYLSIPGSLFFSFIIAAHFARQKVRKTKKKATFTLPVKFFFLTMLSGISGIAFFSLDNILASHFLDPAESGKYAVLGVFGKMIFFIGSITSGFVLPIVARNEGRKRSSKQFFYILLSIISAMSLVGYLCFALGITFFGHLYLGEKVLAIIPYLPFYGLGVMAFTISQTFVNYHLAKKHYIFPVTAFAITLLEVLLIVIFHASLTQVVSVMIFIGILNIATFFIMHFFYDQLKIPFRNVKDFTELFTDPDKNTRESQAGGLRILIFAWRDIRHVWSGGAEVYIHEISKRLVKKGNKVTIFCGNDGKTQRNEVIDGVQVIRRGGFYTVYIWGFLYYILRLRPHTDIIIDTENGVPFLTPLYTRKPILLLIHHIHQEVFRTSLRFPFSTLALFVEAKLMPFLYKNKTILTVSKSSKEEIIRLGLGSLSTIKVINPGITGSLFAPHPKTKFPSLAYVGRLKTYKNIDVALKAFAHVLPDFPKAMFYIAGSGEEGAHLNKLIHSLHIEDNAFVLGKVSDEQKARILAESWFVVQPSMIEGWGITVIEANASGTPVIASDTQGLRDSIIHGDTGILVKPKDVQGFAQAMVDLLMDKKFRSYLSSNAYEWSKRFSWTTGAQEFLTVLRRQDVHTKKASVLSRLLEMERDF